MTYPKSNAYRSETGGLQAALRELTVEQIREYHASSYIPSNLTLLITGSSCPLPSLLHTLQTVVEPRILEKKGGRGGEPPEGWKRPFVESSSRERVDWGKEGSERKEVVEFMEKDESMGEVQIAFGGKGVSRDDFVGCMAIDGESIPPLADPSMPPSSASTSEADNHFTRPFFQSLRLTSPIAPSLP
jgi:Zn-dependent M16 (insulinase) family peptidase